jgi:hypothetical protein
MPRNSGCWAVAGIGFACTVLVTIGARPAMAGLDSTGCGGWHSGYATYVESQRALASGRAITTSVAAIHRMEALGFSQIRAVYQDGAGGWHGYGIKNCTLQLINLDPSGQLIIPFPNVWCAR